MESEETDALDTDTIRYDILFALKN